MYEIEKHQTIKSASRNTEPVYEPVLIMINLTMETEHHPFQLIILKYYRLRCIPKEYTNQQISTL